MAPIILMSHVSKLRNEYSKSIATRQYVYPYSYTGHKILLCANKHTHVEYICCCCAQQHVEHNKYTHTYISAL